MLIKAAHRSRFTVIPMTGNIREEFVRVTAGEDTLEGNLSIPTHAGGIVLFAHGSGSSRLSPRNRFVAHVLARARLTTLLFDLLTRHSSRNPARSMK
jgi:putative phosphoribosyl transferase